MSKKARISKKDIAKLKPVILESKNNLKKIEEASKNEEDFFEEEEQQFQQRFSNFNSPILPFKAPILEKTNTLENLEEGIANAPSTSTAEQATTTAKEITYVQNLPKYSSADYASRRSYETNDSRDTRADREVNIARAREFTATAANPQTRSINMGLWQRENVFNRPDMSREEEDRDYVLQAKEKKEKGKLPFQ
jgi:hypothetical protein